MGRKPIWSKEDIETFKLMPVLELRKLYPEKSYQYLRQIKKYYMERQPDNQEPEKRLYKTWETSAFNKETGEWETTTNHGYEFIHDTKNSLVVEPVVPAVITPNRARIPKRNHEVIFVFSDAQIGYRRINGELVPLHDEAAIKAAQLLAGYLKPNYVYDAGDTTDFAELSKYPVDSDHFQGTLQPSLQRTHDMFAEFTAATPGAERVTVDSNHVKRLGTYVLKNAFALYGITAPGDKYPALSYPGLLKLDEIGWNFVGGYGSAEIHHKGNDNLVITHGLDSVAGGSTASKLSRKNYGRNIIQGHAHRMESQYQTDRYGQMFGAFVVGALCRRDGTVPGYHTSIDQFNQTVKRYDNWQNGCMVVKSYGDNRFQFDQVPIIDGVILYDGKVFDGNA